MRQCKSCGGNCGGGYGSKPCQQDAVEWNCLRCEQTGNPCGTDTTAKHMPCGCAPCIAHRRIAELETENAELKAAAIRAAILLNHATYHDGRYNQHTSFEWQKEACEVADILERLAPQPPQQEQEK